jgi:hypothetical protein
LPKQTKRRGKPQAREFVQNTENRRNKSLRWVSIAIIMALILSLLVGALSVTPSAPASAAGFSAYSADSDLVDTDGDGIENNADSDVDGDGIVNGEDPDIDGDGIENFDDADPIDTTDVDSNAPQKPIRPVGAGDIFVQSTDWIWYSGLAIVFAAISAWLLAKRRKN